ncbi:predicted protein, partial [Arabidopsis lyrata subsp. lyrata]
VAAEKGPNWNELELALNSCRRSWSLEKRKMLGLLFVVHYDRTSYAIHGCPHVLNIWAFDSIPHLRKSYGNKAPDDGDGNEDEDEPEPVPLLQWNESGFDDVPEIEKKTVKRKKAVDSEDDFVDPPTKRKAETEKWGRSSEEHGMERLFKMIGSLSTEMKTLNTDFVAGLEKVDNKCEALKKSVTDLQGDVEKLRKKAEEKNDDIEEESANGSKEGIGTNDESWHKQEKQTSQEGFLISVVVRKAKGKGKRKAGSRSPLPFPEEKLADWDRRDTRSSGGVMSNSMLHNLKNFPLGRCINNKPSSPKKRLTSLSEKKKPEPDLDSEWSDPKEKEKDKKLTATIDKMVELCSKEDFVPRPCRSRNLASTQLDPYIGSSIVKRILRGKILSHAAYDPFEPVTPEKMDNLEPFIDHDLENPIDSTNSSAMFYLKIMTQKEQWLVGELEYGWLTDVVYNGKSPNNGKTYKKWVKDIDILYLTHNIGKYHWVTLEVNLAMRRIKVYDSICSCYSDGQIYEACEKFTRMIPALIQVMSPVEERKKLGAAAFSIYRVKTAPQNYQTGDCSVYSIKFIECLAIGISFEGLCDSAMPCIRLKLVVEVFDEVPDSGCFVQMLHPRGDDTYRRCRVHLPERPFLIYS